MAETTTVHENVSVSLSNNENDHSNTEISDNSQLDAESTSISNNNSELSIASTQIQTHHSTFNEPSYDVSNTMVGLSIHGNRPDSTRSRPKSNLSYRREPYSSFQSTSSINQPDTQAQLVAFTPPLMSLQFPFQQSQRNHRSTRPYTPTQRPSLPAKSKSETTVSQPEYYVDSYASNFANKPSSNSNSNKTKTKHVTFQEPDTTNEPFGTNSVCPPSSSNGYDYPCSHWTTPTPAHPNRRPFHRYNHPANYYPRQGFYSQYPDTMMHPQFMSYPRPMQMMSAPPVWTPPPHYYNPQMIYTPYSPRPRQLYDPNQPKAPSTSESYDSSKVPRPITTKNKKKAKQPNIGDSPTIPTPESIAHPITILRKPNVDREATTSPVENQLVTPLEEEGGQVTASFIEEQITTKSEEQSPSIISSNIPTAIEQTMIRSTDNQSDSSGTMPLPSHELLSILQSANCIASLNEYAQQKKFPLNYEFASVSPSAFTCTMSINGRTFSTSSPCGSKSEAQKLVCDQAIRILYRESSSVIQSSPEFSSKHDHIAHRSVSTFQDLNVNEFLLGRKTLACMLMIIDQQFGQARVISMATGNSCLDESNLSYADDGAALHDCHAEILARRGLIKFLLEEIKRSKDHQPSIFEYNSTINKYQLQENITFHMYISSLPCGNAALNIPSNAIRYKQGRSEGTLLASSNSTKYPIKSCSDKIYRWNILGIQGGLVISLLTKPIYLQTITIACETTFDRTRVNSSLYERLKEHLHSLPSPFVLHIPDINCPTLKSFQQERQVAKLQTNAFAWNITKLDRTELLEPITGRLKTDRSVSSLSKQNLFQDFLEILPEKSLTYHQAKQLDQNYLTVKELISTAFQSASSDENVSWISKSDQLEEFPIQ